MFKELCIIQIASQALALRACPTLCWLHCAIASKRMSLYVSEFSVYQETFGQASYGANVCSQYNVEGMDTSNTNAAVSEENPVKSSLNLTASFTAFIEQPKSSLI